MISVVILSDLNAYAKCCYSELYAECRNIVHYAECNGVA